MGFDVEAFDREVGAGRLSAVATAHGIDPDRLAVLAAETQSLAESVRTVDELVFEYRKAYGDVVAERTDSAYFLLVPPHVWAEFAERLDAGDAERGALESLHAAWFEEQCGPHSNVDTGERTPLVVRSS